MKASNSRYMVVYQYGSAVLFNIEDHEVETYLELVKRHASGLLSEMRKDGKFFSEKPIYHIVLLSPFSVSFNMVCVIRLRNKGEATIS